MSSVAARVATCDVAWSDRRTVSRVGDIVRTHSPDYVLTAYVIRGN
jgi:hypothetical protein